MKRSESKSLPIDTDLLFDIDLKDKLRMIRAILSTCEDDWECQQMMVVVKEHLEEVFEMTGDHEHKYQRAADLIQKAIDSI